MGALAQDIGTAFMNGLLSGIYFITFCYANRWLLFTSEGWKPRRRIQWALFTITNLIAALLLIDAVLDVYTPMAQMTFVEKGGDPTAWKDFTWDSILRCMIANAIALLADIVLMYRLWVTHARQMWIMWFPIFLWVGGIICTILQLYLQIVHIHNPNFGPYHWSTVNMSVGPGIVLTPFWASTIALNAYCTGILIWRIWGASKTGDNSSASKRLRFLVRILMESGILYLIISLAHFFVWFGHDNFVIFLLAGMNTSVIGIAFNLVLIRTAQNKAGIEEVYNSGGTQGTAINFISPPIISVQVQSRIDTDSSPTEYGHLEPRGILDIGNKRSH